MSKKGLTNSHPRLTPDVVANSGTIDPDDSGSGWGNLVSWVTYWALHLRFIENGNADSDSESCHADADGQNLHIYSHCSSSARFWLSKKILETKMRETHPATRQILRSKPVLVCFRAAVNSLPQLFQLAMRYLLWCESAIAFQPKVEHWRGFHTERVKIRTLCWTPRRLF